MIDWERVNALHEEVGPEDFGEVIDLFLEEVDTEIETLRNASNTAELGSKLHFLKGSALSLGFRKFSALCQEGEAALSKSSQTDIDVLALLECYQVSRAEFLANVSDRITA